jgi:hypothetical protein
MRSSTVLPVSAIIAVVLFFAGSAVLGTPPTGGASGQDVVSWFATNTWQVRAAVWLWTLQAVVWATAIALARNRLPAPHRDVFFVGGITLSAEAAVSTWFWAGLSWHATDLRPETARALLDVTSFWGPVLTGSTLAMTIPVASLSLGKRPVLPRWLGAVGALALVEQLIESVATIFGQSGFTEPGGAMNLELGAALVSIWFICLAVSLGRRSGAVAARPGLGGEVPQAGRG